MSAYKGRRVFRTSPGYMVIFVWAELMFLSGAVFTYRAGGWSWTSIGLAGLPVLCLGAVLERAVHLIVLADVSLYVTDLWGRRRYLKSQSVWLHEAEGVATTTGLADGRRVRLPALGHVLGN